MLTDLILLYEKKNREGGNPILFIISMIPLYHILIRHVVAFCGIFQNPLRLLHVTV